LLSEEVDPPFAARPFGRAISLQRPPLVPEIALWLLAEEVDLESVCAGLGETEGPPFWAFCWGSGQALARWVLDHPDEVRNRDIVDLGTGSGIVAIAAALCGARRVVAVDVDSSALEAALGNARENGVEIEVAVTMPARCDLLIASDVLYEARERVLGDVSARFGVLLAEPARPGLVPPPERPIHTYDVRTFPDVDSPTCAASVYRLAPRGHAG
jgi:predicted nicotinamide N-methyase